MNRSVDTLVTSFSLFLITAVTLLIPGPGLATLPIPDNEPDTVIVALLNYAHAGKRSSDDPSHPLLGFVPAGSQRAEMLAVSSDVLLGASSQVFAMSLTDTEIRGPPSIPPVALITNSFTNNYD